MSSSERPRSDVDLGLFNCNPPGIGLRALLREDYDTHERDWLSQGFWAIAVHRFGNWRMGVRSRILRAPLSLLYRWMAKWVEWLTGIDLPYTVKVGRRVHLWHQGGMILVPLEIGDDVHIRQNTTMGVRRRDDPRWLRPVIEAGCDIGAGAVIVGPIRIGRNSVIGANAVIASDIPPNSIATLPAVTVRGRT